ncbi:GA4 desaturase-like protein [Colletotrichum graminicola]|nr:GA4 desaturase-like protein [Colletotrichum graminicola]
MLLQLTAESRYVTTFQHQKQVLASFNNHNGWSAPALNDLTITEGASTDNKNGADSDGPHSASFSIWRAWETVYQDSLAVMDMSRPVLRKIEYAPLVGPPGVRAFLLKPERADPAAMAGEKGFRI